MKDPLTLVTVMLAVVEILVLITIERHKPTGSATLFSIRRVVGGLCAIVLLTCLYVLAHETRSTTFRNALHYVPVRFGSLKANLIFLVFVTFAIGLPCTEVNRGRHPPFWDPLIPRSLISGGLIGLAFGIALLLRRDLLDSSFASNLIVTGIVQGAITASVGAVFCAWCFRPCVMPDD
jgi:hypothetical protein